MPRRHGADRVEGFPCNPVVETRLTRTHTLARSRLGIRLLPFLHRVALSFRFTAVLFAFHPTDISAISTVSSLFPPLSPFPRLLCSVAFRESKGGDFTERISGAGAFGREEVGKKGKKGRKGRKGKKGREEGRRSSGSV